MARGSRPTMNDVARKAGVSQTTVSLVLNQVESASIPDETRAKVEGAARELGYRPNRNARALRTRASHLIGLVTDAIATSPFAGSIIEAAQTVAVDHGKMLMLANTGGDRGLERTAIETLLEHQVEALMIAAMYLREVEPSIHVDGVPLVYVNCFPSDERLTAIVPDEVYGGHAVTRLLLDRSHRRIGFINGEKTFLASRERLSGYRQALAEADLPFKAELTSYGSWWPDNGYLNTKRLLALRDPPTAIFCGNDRIAVGAYLALKEAHRLIPDDVAIVGYDGEEIAAHLNPALSTFTLPHAEMGAEGMGFLLAAAAGEGHRGRVRVRGQFIERSSA